MKKLINDLSILEDIADGNIIPLHAEQYEKIKKIFTKLATLEPPELENNDIIKGYLLAIKQVHEILDTTLNSESE